MIGLEFYVAMRDPGGEVAIGDVNDRKGADTRRPTARDDTLAFYAYFQILR